MMILDIAPTLSLAQVGSQLPVHDWQFWVVTALAGAAAAVILFRVIRPRGRPRPKRSVRAELTIEGRSARRR